MSILIGAKGRGYLRKVRWRRSSFLRDLVLRSLRPLLSLLFFLGIACFNCSNERTGYGALSEDAFVRLFVDMAAITYRYESEPEQLRIAYEQVMHQYGLSEGHLAEALLSFEERPERWFSIVEGIAEELERLSHKGGI